MTSTDVINAAEPDVLFLQDVDMNWGERSNYADTLAILTEKPGSLLAPTACDRLFYAKAINSRIRAFPSECPPQ